MKELPNLKQLTEEAKDALIVELWEKVQKFRETVRKETQENIAKLKLTVSTGI